MVQTIAAFLAFAFFAPLVSAGHSVNDPVAAARAAFAAGDYSEAVKLYREAVETHPKSAALQTALGLAYQMGGNHQQAIRSYSAALHLQQLPQTRELLAIEHCRLREYSAASPLLDQIADHPVAGDTLLPVLAPCYLQANNSLGSLRISQAMTVFGILPPDQNLVYRSRASMAASKIFIGRLSQAPGGETYLEYLKRARDAGSADARSGFPAALHHSNYLHAGLTLEQGLALLPKHPGDPALLYMLAVFAGEQAMQSILDCQNKYPDSPWLAQFQAQMLAAQGHAKEAETIYTQLMTAHPELPDLSHDLAMLYRSQAEWEPALNIFRAELAADPTDDRAITGISESLIQLGRYQQAVDFLTPRFAKTAPLWAAMDLSLAQQKLGRYPEAIAVLTRAAIAYPGEKSIHFRLMRLYTITGQPELAQKESTLFSAEKRP